MINHITLRVSDFEKSKKFYLHALKPLGYQLLKETPEQKVAGFGIEDIEGKRDFWIKEGTRGTQPTIACLAFAASDKRMVNDFHKAALEAGAKNNGAPGYRKKYHAGYYAAYILDPDGNNIEAVFDDPNEK